MTKEEAKEKWLEFQLAESRIVKGKSYTIGGRTLTRADEQFIKERMSYYAGLYYRLCANGHTGIKARKSIPHG